jgi:hypothetical protein
VAFQHEFRDAAMIKLTDCDAAKADLDEKGANVQPRRGIPTCCPRRGDE